MGDANCKNRFSSLMKYKGILQPMQSMGRFLTVRPHRVVFLGGVLPRYTVKKGDSQDIPKKKRGTRGIFAGSILRRRLSHGRDAPGQLNPLHSHSKIGIEIHGQVLGVHIRIGFHTFAKCLVQDIKERRLRT